MTNEIIQTRTGDYNISTLMFIGICLIGWVFAIVIMFMDYRGSKILLKSAKERELLADHTADSEVAFDMDADQLDTFLFIEEPSKH